MAERVSETLHKKLSDRLGFYEDLGIQLFYRERSGVATADSESRAELSASTRFAAPDLQKEEPLPKSAGKPALQKAAPALTPVSPKIASLPVIAGPSLFESMEKITGDSLLKTRGELRECTRCKLPTTPHNTDFCDS